MLGTKHLTWEMFSNSSKIALGGKGGQWQDEIQQDRSLVYHSCWKQKFCVVQSEVLVFPWLWVKMPISGANCSSRNRSVPTTSSRWNLYVYPASVLLEPSRVNGSYLSWVTTVYCSGNPAHREGKARLVDDRSPCVLSLGCGYGLLPQTPTEN